MPKLFNAFEIDSPRAATVARAMCSGLRDRRDDELIESFIVIDYPQDGVITLITPEELAEEEMTLSADGSKLRLLYLEK